MVCHSVNWSVSLSFILSIRLPVSQSRVADRMAMGKSIKRLSVVVVVVVVVVDGGGDGALWVVRL